MSTLDGGGPAPAGAIVDDSTVKYWGSSACGQLGDSSALVDRHAPAAVLSFP